MSRKGQKIVMLRGPSTPKVFAGHLVEHADDIEQIACVIQWKNGHTTVNSTSMQMVDAAWLDYVFRADFMAQMEEAETLDPDG